MNATASKCSEEGEIFQEIREDFSGVGQDLKGLMEFRYMAEVGAIHLRHGREHKSERV